MYRENENGEIYVKIKIPELAVYRDYLMGIVKRHINNNDIRLIEDGEDFLDVAVKDADGFTDLAIKLWMYRQFLKSFENGKVREHFS